MNLQAGTKVLVEAVVDGEIYGDAVPVELTTWRGDTMRQWFKDSTIHPFPGVQEWRPIDSAPKDGTPILTLRRSVLQGVAEYDLDRQIWRMVHGPDIVGVTHWMALPPPPSSAEQGEGG